MKMLEEVQPDAPWIVRTPCCDRKRTRSEARVVPHHGIAFFAELETRRPGTLAEIGFVDPVPETMCGGCYEKLWGVWRLDGQRQRLMTKPDAMALVWRETLPANERAKGEAWEQRRHRGRTVPVLPAAVEARGE